MSRWFCFWPPEMTAQAGWQSAADPPPELAAQVVLEGHDPRLRLDEDPERLSPIDSIPANAAVTIITGISSATAR